MIRENVVIVIDMQNGVFANPRFDREGRVVRINQLIDHADQVIFIQHAEDEMTQGSENCGKSYRNYIIHRRLFLLPKQRATRFIRHRSTRLLLS